MEWVRRYLPCEIAGTVGELGGAAVAFIRHIKKSLGVDGPVIDIGGGFSVRYREPMPTIDAIGDIIDDVLRTSRRRGSTGSPPPE